MAKKKTFFQKNRGTIYVLSFFLILGFLISYLSTQPKIEENLSYGDDEIIMDYFHLTTCPHCHEQNKFHPTLLAKYPNVHIVEHEMTHAESVAKYKEMAANIEGLDVNKFPGTPLTIINGKFNVGFGTAETTGVKLMGMVQEVQDSIDANWNDSKVKTLDLRLQELEKTQ